MPPDTVVQKYIQHPLLLGDRKFSICCFLLVLNVRPAFVLLHPGYIRRALNKSVDHARDCVFMFCTGTFLASQQRCRYIPSDVIDDFGHCTNLRKMKQHPNFSVLRDDCALPLSKLSSAFKGLKNASTVFDSEIFPKIRLCLTAALLQASSELLQARGSFGFLSANVIIDSTLNPWLLSMDRAPDLEAYNAFQDSFLPSLVEETVKLMHCFLIEHAEDGSGCRAAVKQKLQGYSVLLDER
jgi:hypothetical protein